MRVYIAGKTAVRFGSQRKGIRVGDGDNADWRASVQDPSDGNDHRFGV